MSNLRKEERQGTLIKTLTQWRVGSRAGGKDRQFKDAGRIPCPQCSAWPTGGAPSLCAKRKGGTQAGKKRAGGVHRQLIKPKPLLAGGVGAFSLSLGIQGPRVSG